MISRVIEAKADDMRMFVEEAAGISRYKERRKETEARISDTRENLERLQDVRDEVDKQIRHLQRQAATARRYQALKETERRLTAELLALRLREIDSGAEVQDSAVRECELRMQSALADQRAAEAAIETQRVYQAEQSERVTAVQGRYYESAPRSAVPSRPSRIRASCASSSATSWRRRGPRWPSSSRTSSATRCRSSSCAPRSRSSVRTWRRRRPRKAH
jgi:chromosome segregation ATPase